MSVDIERAAAAFRAAMRNDEPEVVDLRLEPGAVRKRLRRRQLAGGVVALALVLLIGAAILPHWNQSLLLGPSDQPPGSRTAPAGWRIEQYRTVSILVPDSWGYASAPFNDWCLDSPDGQPTVERLTPYVALGQQSSISGKMLHKPCPEQPVSLLTEHVELTLPGEYAVSASPYPQEQQSDGWWIDLRLLGPDSDPVAVKVVSRDRNLAQRIADSAEVGGPCPSTSPVQENQRNPDTVDLDLVRDAGRAVICQYEPGFSAIPSRPPGSYGPPVRLTGLQASSVLSRGSARSLLAQLEAASALAPTRPACEPDDASLALAIAVHLYAGQREGTVYLTAGRCNTYAKNGPIGAETGGIDIGSATYPWTRAVCDAIVKPPVVVDRSVNTWACSP